MKKKTTTSSAPAPSHEAKEVERLRAALAGTSFSFEEEPIRERLIISVEGKEKQGKTHFALTAPGPICYQSIDIGDEGVVQKFTGDKKILKADYVIDIDKRMRDKGEDAVITHIAQLWEKFVDDYYAALKSGVRTIVWDTATEVWEFLRLARLGKLTQVMPKNYTEVNNEFRGLLRKAYSHDSNLILIHKSKEAWEDVPTDRGVKSRKTGLHERKGMSDVQFLVQVLVKAYREEVHDEKKNKSVSEFGIQITDSRHNPEANGLDLPNADFATVASYIMPDVDESAWQ